MTSPEPDDPGPPIYRYPPRRIRISSPDLQNNDEPVPSDPFHPRIVIERNYESEEKEEEEELVEELENEEEEEEVEMQAEGEVQEEEDIEIGEPVGNDNELHNEGEEEAVDEEKEKPREDSISPTTPSEEEDNLENKPQNRFVLVQEGTNSSSDEKNGEQNNQMNGNDHELVASVGSIEEVAQETRKRSANLDSPRGDLGSVKDVSERQMVGEVGPPPVRVARLEPSAPHGLPLLANHVQDGKSSTKQENRSNQGLSKQCG